MGDADASGLLRWAGELAWVWMVFYTLSVAAVRAFGDIGRAGLEELLSRYDEERRRREEPRVSFLLRTGHWALDAAVVLKALMLALLAVGLISGYAWKGVLYFALLVFAGEVILDGVFSTLAAELAYYAGGAFAVFLFPLRVLVWSRRPVSTGLERVLGRNRPQEAHEELEGEIMAIVSEGERDGVIEEADRDVIEGVFSLKDKDIADVMTPRTDIVCIEAGSTVEEARRLALSTGHSRVPVYQDTRDNIVGILYVKDLLAYWNHDERDGLSVRDIMRQPVFVPERRKVSGLLREMQLSRSHMAIVLDEYGGTAGLVTVEDILEEFVGEIVDEYDRSVPPLYERLPDNSYRVKARMHMDEFNELLGVELPENEDYDTIGGFIVSELGYIPPAGEKIPVDGLEITVAVSSERRVDVINVRKVESGEGEG